MSHENNSEIVDLHKKIENIEEQMKQLIKINNKIEYELSKIMPFLISFASNTSDDLHHIKYK
jgi:hypothetical protein